MTWAEYAEGLEENLLDLHTRVHAGAYRALPSRRTYIPKADGRQRPLGIAALEDKIVQAAVVAILMPIYEAEFLGFSYGFRPKRNQHQALDALAFGIGRRRINWVLDVDADNIPKDHLLMKTFVYEHPVSANSRFNFTANAWRCRQSRTPQQQPPTATGAD
jgi:retron-type reverse transcriptase